MSDQIIIKNLRISTHIGVPAEERAMPQVLELSLWLQPSNTFDQLDDDIAKTVDYFQLTQRIHQLAGEKPRQLIETFAHDVVTMALAEFDLLSVELELHKFILPDTEFVGVRIKREQVSS